MQLGKQASSVAGGCTIESTSPGKFFFFCYIHPPHFLVCIDLSKHTISIRWHTVPHTFFFGTIILFFWHFFFSFSESLGLKTHVNILYFQSRKKKLRTSFNSRNTQGAVPDQNVFTFLWILGILFFFKRWVRVTHTAGYTQYNGSCCDQSDRFVTGSFSYFLDKLMLHTTTTTTTRNLHQIFLLIFRMPNNIYADVLCSVQKGHSLWFHLYRDERSTPRHTHNPLLLLCN